MSKNVSVEKLVDAVLKGEWEPRESEANELMRACGIWPDDTRGLVAQCSYVTVSDSDIEFAIGEVLGVFEEYFASTRIAELNDGVPPTQAERDLYRMAVAYDYLGGD